jgi:hypothetical protein
MDSGLSVGALGGRDHGAGAKCYLRATNARSAVQRRKRAAPASSANVLAVLARRPVLSWCHNLRQKSLLGVSQWVSVGAIGLSDSLTLELGLTHVAVNAQIEPEGTDVATTWQPDQLAIPTGHRCGSRTRTATHLMTGTERERSPVQNPGCRIRSVAAGAVS